MGCFCIGSYTRVLLSCAVKGETQSVFCPKLFALLDPMNKDCMTEDTIGQILGGAQNLNPDWITAAKENISPAYAERYFYQIIRPCIENQKKELLVLGLKEIIRADSMRDDIELGTISSMTKKDFLEMTTVPLTQVLMDLFLYAVIHTDNKDQSKYVKGIKKTYCDQFMSDRDTIKTYEAEAVRPMKSISSSLRGKKFDSTFSKIYETTIGTPRPNHVRIYRVELDEAEFVYEQLQNFVENSIGYYLLSRTQVREYIEDEEEARIYPEGVRILKEQYKLRHKEVEDALGELLLYSFLEKALSAPKIMNSMEMNQTGYQSDSIHLLKLPGQDAQPVYQVVFGTSRLVGDLRTAVADALNKVAAIHTNRRRERRLINPASLRQVFSEEEANEVKRIVIPNDLSVDWAGDAFGIFLGYTPKLPDSSTMSDEEFKAAVAKRLEDDVADNIDFIEKQLVVLGLNTSSLYVYLLPFNNVEADKKQIMAHALGMGGESS